MQRRVKILQCSGTCSFATLLAHAGSALLPQIRLVRPIATGKVVCIIETGELCPDAATRLHAAIQAAHAIEPVDTDHDVAIDSSVLTFLTQWLDRAAME